MTSTLKIGTRGSKLAVAQSGWVRDCLIAAGFPAELVIIKTTGDRIQDRPLQAIGGKGLFTKELEEGLLAGDLDLAVHSLKDMPSDLPPGLTIGAVPEREDPRDVLVPRDPSVKSIGDLPEGAIIATGSLRRKAQLLRLRPDLKIVGIRGNIDTRLRKLQDGVDGMDATLLAAAGLNRLGIFPAHGIVLSTDEMLPAVGQGALAIESSLDANHLEPALLAIHHTPTATCIAAERELLDRLEGTCTIPMAGLAELDGSEVRVRGLVSGETGDPWFYDEKTGPGAYSRRLGGALGEALLDAGAEALLEELRG